MRPIIPVLLLPALSSTALAIPDVCDPSPPLIGQRLVSAAELSHVGSGENDRHGHAVTTIDLDGDGVLDLVVGAPGDASRSPWSGRVTVDYGPFGDGDGGAGTADLVLWGAPGARAGWSLANGGDLDGDGLDDLVIGAPNLGGMGGVFVLHGGQRLTGTDRLAAVADAVSGPTAGSGFGSAVSAAGDLNGDGFADLAVGAPLADAGTGTAFVFYGPLSATAAPQADVILRGAAFGGEVGSAFAPLGDWNGDGLDDLAIGAPAGEGVVHLLHGGTNLPRLPTASSLRIRGLDADRLGEALAAPGDLDGDGYTDLILGAPQALNLLGEVAGAVHVFFGGPVHASQYFATDANLSVWGDEAGMGFGRSLAVVQVDGDQSPELLVGAPAGRGIVPRGGAAYLFDDVLSAGPGSDNAYARFAGTTTGGSTGLSLAALPDLNQDGYRELAVGSPRDEAAGTVRTGRLSTWFGGEDLADLTYGLRDQDGDGYGAPGTWIETCGLPPGYVQNADDCDDTDAAISPDAEEICTDTIDQNCDGRADCLGGPRDRCEPRSPLALGNLGPLPTVTDIAVSAGVQAGPNRTLQRGRACVVADLDNDGRDDLYVGNPSDSSYVLRNLTAPGQPIQFGAPLVLVQNHLSWGAAGADYDKDGDIDLFLAGGGNEGRDHDILLQNRTSETGQLGFVDVGEPIRGIVGADGLPQDGASGNALWADFDNDGDVDIFVNGNIYGRTTATGDAGRNTVWRNDNGQFTDVTELWNLAESRRATRHSTAFDYDNDGDLDLYENNYIGDNILYRNNLVETGLISFSDVTRGQSTPFADLREPYRSFASMAGDLNNDGWEDLIVLSRGFRSPECGGGASDPDASFDAHAIFLNLGEGRGFVEVADAAGINHVGLSAYDPSATDQVMGCQLADLDANGILDLYIGNGGPPGGGYDYLYAGRRLQRVNMGTLGEVDVPLFEDWTALIDFPATPAPNLNSAWPPYPYRTHGTCAGDFNGDGLLELFVSNGGTAASPDDVAREPDRLFQFSFANGATPHHLLLRLRGDGEEVNRDAVGAGATITVRLPNGGTRLIQRRLYAGSAFSAQNGMNLHFGLGGAVAIEAIEVRWPDGLVQALPGPFSLDSTITVQR